MKNLLFYLVALAFLFFDLSGASALTRVDGDGVEGKKRMAVEDVLEWKRITEKAISPDGKYVAVTMEPWKGTSVVKLYDNKGEEVFSVDSSSSIYFDDASQFLFFKRESAEIKERNVEKGCMLGIVPLKDLIYSLNDNRVRDGKDGSERDGEDGSERDGGDGSGRKYGVQYISGVKSHVLPEEANATLFVHMQDSSLQIVKPHHLKEEISSKLYSNETSSRDDHYEISSNVLHYKVSENGKAVVVSLDGAVLKYSFGFEDVRNKQDSFCWASDTLWDGNGEVKKLAVNDDASLVSFLVEDELFISNSESVSECMNDKAEDVIIDADGENKAKGVSIDKEDVIKAEDVIIDADGESKAEVVSIDKEDENRAEVVNIDTEGENKSEGENKAEDVSIDKEVEIENGKRDKDGDESVTEKSIMVAKGVSDKHELFFSPDGSKLYFSFRRSLPVRDSSVKDDDFPEVHIWNWKENVQFTEQVVNEKEMSQAGELAVYDLAKESFFKIENENATRTLLVDEGDSPLAVVLSDVEYSLERMWTGRTRYDVYVVDTYLERSMFALKGIDGYPRVSPAGKYLYWYSAPDSSWITYSLEDKEKKVVTPPSVLPVYDVDNDVPDWPSSYYAAGWSEEDEAFLVYDKYDIWSVDPKGVKEPVNITSNGSESKVTYRYVKQSEDEECIDLRRDMMLMGFDNTTKGFGYYLLKKSVLLKRLDRLKRSDRSNDSDRLNGSDGLNESGKSGVLSRRGSGPEVLYAGDFMLGTPVRAADSDEWIFTRETFSEFPDVRYSNKDFSKRVRITDANPQQQNYIWGSAQLVSWISYDGKKMEGVVYRPENYDPSLKYPVIVNFYEKNSSELHSYRTPEAHRSTIDYHLYSSHGYVIFNPDVAYKDGYPGESAYNSVMPGVSKLIEEGVADPERIGAQGHSWGGYQVAYLATRTPLFAAIESGAPVVNMFSAYGGIRWGSGKNRSFQYEHQQSRIGKTPWESPLRYMENSPLFTMDKVETPILIMHNDNDGHVPWYQGIEYFVALKRLQKPVWLLNYTGEVHWPQKLKNKVDFQIRMKQFFDHYLKDAEAPEWMDPGISLIELNARTGY